MKELAEIKHAFVALAIVMLIVMVVTTNFLSVRQTEKLDINIKVYPENSAKVSMEARYNHLPLDWDVGDLELNIKVKFADDYNKNMIILLQDARDGKEYPIAETAFQKGKSVYEFSKIHRPNTAVIFVSQE